MSTSRVDVEAPALKGAASVTPSVGRLDTTFRVSFEVTEPLLEDPRVSAKIGGAQRALIHESGESDPPLFVFSYRLVGDEPEQEIPLEVRLVDFGGNVAEGLPAGSLRFDFTRPIVVGGSASVAPGRMPAGDTVRIQFAVSEPLAEPPRVVAGDAGEATLAPEQPEGAGLVFAYDLVPVPESADGLHEVVAHLVDLAGNTHPLAPLGHFVIDSTPPRLTPGDVEMSPPAPIRLRAELTILVTADELLASAEIRTTPAIDMGDAIVAGPVAVWRRRISADDPDGPFAATVTIRDLVGNEMVLELPKASILEIADLDGDGYAVEATASGLPGGTATTTIR